MEVSMSDQSSAISKQDPGQGPESEQTQGKEVQQEYLTRAEVANLLKEQEDRFVSRTQGLLDSMGSSVQKRVQTGLQSLQKVIEDQKAAGIEITPQQEEALKQRTVMNVLSEEPEEPEPSEPPTTSPGEAQPGEQKEAPDPITQSAWDMMKDRGVEILDEDPEIEILDTSTPYKFLLSVDKAITAKETRLQNEPPPEETEEKTGSPHGRIPGAGAGGSTGSLLPDGTPPLDRLNSYYKKKRGR
jgi:hypothetical protein